MAYIKSYKHWQSLNEQGVDPTKIEKIPIVSDRLGPQGSFQPLKFLDSKPDPFGAKESDPNASEINPSQNLNRTPSKYYDEVRSGIFDLHEDSFKILADNNRISKSDLLKAGSKYIPTIDKIKDEDLKSFIKKIIAGENPDLDSAYKKFDSGEWQISPLAENGEEMYIFDWMPVDSDFTQFKLRPAKSAKFGGKIAWVFTDNMWYPIISKQDPDVKGVLNGFVNGANNKATHSFKPGDTVYVKMFKESLDRLDATQKSHMEWNSGLQYITKMAKNEGEYSSIFNSNPDSVAIERQRGPNTPTVPGYIVLVERENIGKVSKSDKSYGSIQGEQYHGLII